LNPHTVDHREPANFNAQSIRLFHEPDRLQFVIEEINMCLRLTVTATVLIAVQSFGFAQEEGSPETAPRFLVDAEIVDSPFGHTFIAARLYFDQIGQSYHDDYQRDRIKLANRKQELSVLQSELVRFPVRGLQFKTVEGKTLTPDDVRVSLRDKMAVLLLPEGASLHPAIKATLKPDAIIVSKVRGASPRRLVTRPKPR
jgi:hypothetical protein